MDDLDEALLDAVQDAFPIRPLPYEELAERCGTSPGEAERRVAEMRDTGVIRRLGAVIDSRALGMTTTLAAADVEASSIEAVAGHVDRYPEVTHSYLREGRPALWFALVAASRGRIDAIMREVRDIEGVLSASEFPATRVYKLSARVKAGASPPAHQGSQVGGPSTPSRLDGEKLMKAGEARLSKIERAVLRELAVDLPGGAAPYAEVASRAGLGEEEVLETVRGLVERGVVRRVAAIVRDRKLGYDANAMVVWRVPTGLAGEDGDAGDAIERAGRAAAARSEISHCYARRTSPDWRFNFYTMVHARSQEELAAVVDSLRREIGGGTGDVEHRILATLREFTKRRPDYAAVLGGEK